MSDLLPFHFFRILIVFRFIVPLLYTHIKRVNSLEMCLPGRKDTHLLVNPRLDILAEDFCDIRNSSAEVSQFCLFSKSVLISLSLSDADTHTQHGVVQRMK